ncbi:hypothetical protein BD324DRAFT_611711 [Kockovaella imperatae]|uniref:SUR7/PalI family-domain-containing protein n=1 Tax=Kockovaella imperatae TaxID=4999 RepID=A0A1Y1URG7_9TREE|nr:hypothetical protein BD324DRAFT_611711 [Kockovaella imperatae]ORX40661.1 hypothetical protein BD324DRAFT_611711 [Kockovaella imperatae]
MLMKISPSHHLTILPSYHLTMVGIKYTVGPVVVLDTVPRHEHRPRVPGNQATALVFPALAALILVLISTLSIPMIHGLSIVDVDMGMNGTVHFGGWGWCSEGVPGNKDMCSDLRGFASGMAHQLEQLPEPVKSLSELDSVVPKAYLTAQGVAEIFSVLFAWIAINCTLAASGFWQSKENIAWSWTSWSFAWTFWSGITGIISWGLALGQVTRFKAHAMRVDGTKAEVTPGPVIWMMLAAILLNFLSFAVRIAWGKDRARPLWTVKGDKIEDPVGDATELPTWDSLNIDPETKRSSIDKSMKM